MSSDESPTSSDGDDGRNITYRVQLQAAHPLHHRHGHPLAFIDSLDTLHRHFMINLQEFSDPSITGILFRSTGFFPCAGCAVPSSGPSFHCLSCPFSLDAACAALPPLAVGHHPHPLLLLRRKSDHKHLICALCDEGISFPSFCRCVQCDAFLHVQCTLPAAIRVEQHVLHPLVLSSPEVLVAGANGGSNSWPEFCCVCGEERSDGVSWVYSCSICRFVAHVGCVIYDHKVASETEAEASITSLLCSLELSDEEESDHQNDGNEESEEEDEIGTRRRREIRNTIIMKPGVSLQQILDSFSEAEETEYQNLVATMVKDAGGDDDDGDGTNSEQKYLNHYSYLEKPLYDLLEKIDLGDDPDSPFQGIEMDSPTVLVAAGRYLASEKLAETFTKIFAKYGDIAESSNLSPKLKMVVWNLLCKVVDDMSKTELKNVNGEVLVSWMIGIRTIQLCGFELGFAWDWWKKTAMAFFGFQGKEMADELAVETDRKIDERRRELEKLCEEREKLLSLMEECVEEGLAMEGKIAGHGFI